MNGKRLDCNNSMLSDDLFAPDHTDVFGSQSDNLFSDNNNLFDAEVSSSLWKDKPLRVSKSTIIPPSFDVPPPMHEGQFLLQKKKV